MKITNEMHLTVSEVNETTQKILLVYKDHIDNFHINDTGFKKRIVGTILYSVLSFAYIYYLI